MFHKKIWIIGFLFVSLIIFTSCGNSNTSSEYSVSGRVIDSNENGIEDVSIFFSGEYGTSTTDMEGKWQKSGLSGTVTITPVKLGYSFEPDKIEVSESRTDIKFIGKNNPLPLINLTKTFDNLTVILKGSIEYNGGAVREVTINWGDNESETITADFNNIEISHKYNHEDTFTITITVTDEDGISSIKPESVKVEGNNPPVIDLKEGIDKLIVKLVGNIEDTDGEVYEVVVDWGDESTDIITSNYDNIEHTYPANGNYTIVITATDDDGDTNRKEIKVEVETNTRPEISLLESIDKLKVNLTGSVEDLDGEISEVEIDWGDGNIKEIFNNFDNISISNTYPRTGNYTITINAMDDSDEKTEKTISVNVKNNEKPVIDLDKSIDHLKVVLTGLIEDPDGEIWEASIDWGDDSTEPVRYYTNLEKKHTYASSGIYTITITATDDDGDTKIEEFNVIVQANTVPVINLLESINKLKVNLAGSVEDIDGEVSEVIINWGDGSRYYIEEDFENINIDYTYSMGSIYSITITAVDDDGDSTVKEFDIIANALPVLDIKMDTDGVDKVTLYGSAVDTDGLIKRMNINWGDGSTDNITDNFENINIDHIYSNGGIYSITLTVTDNFDDSNIEEREIVLQGNNPPVIDIESSTDDLTVTLTGSIEDIDGSVSNVTIDWGDENTDNISSSLDNIEISHSYTSAGTYTILITATDNDSDDSNDEINVEVKENNPPVIILTESVNNMFVELTGSVYDIDGTITELSIDWGDDSTLSIFENFGDIKMDHTYADPGSYTIAIIAIDNDNEESSKEFSIDVIENVPPVINISESTDGYVGNITGSITDSDGELRRVIVDWGDECTDNISSNFGNININHTFPEEGNYTIKITATDDDGAISSQQYSVFINAPPLIDIEVSTGDFCLIIVTGSVSDSDGVSEVIIDWGNEEQDIITSGFDNINISNTVIDFGYCITIYARDNVGGQSHYRERGF